MIIIYDYFINIDILLIWDLISFMNYFYYFIFLIVY